MKASELNKMSLRELERLKQQIDAKEQLAQRELLDELKRQSLIQQLRGKQIWPEVTE